MSLFDNVPRSPSPPVKTMRGFSTSPTRHDASDQGFGLGLKRSMSAQDLPFCGGNESIMSSSSVLPTSRTSELNTQRDMKKKSLLSAHMTSGDGVREAISHTPAPMVRRMVSLPPRLNSPNKAGPEELFSDERSVLSAVMTARSEKSCENQTARAHSPGNSPSSKRSCSETPRSLWSPMDPRAKRRTLESIPDSSLSLTIGSSRSFRSPRAAEDHLWRELFHEEVEERKVARLRGSGQAIGNRGKSSVGIPWRQIPAYDRMGLMSETGDPYATPEHSRRAVAMTYKKKGQFSPRLNASVGVKGVLSSVSENSENTPPPAEPSAREAWLELVKQRCAAKFDKKERQKINRSASTPDFDDDDSSLHWTYRPHKKVSQEINTKDNCPYFREDSIPECRAVQPPTPHKRPVNAPPSNFSSSGPSPKRGSDPTVPEFAGAAERVPESRRDWTYMKEKTDDALSTGRSMMSKSPSARSLNKSMSAQSLSAQTLKSVENPVHSVRARPPTAGRSRPCWK